MFRGEWLVPPPNHLLPRSWIAERIFKKGVDSEREECILLLDINGCPDKWIDMLRARRPKPPVGLTPRLLATEARLAEVQAALKRYRDAEQEPPGEWLDEQHDLKEALFRLRADK